MTNRGLDATLKWLRTSVASPIPAEWVPGALESERRALGVLGAVAMHTLGGSVPRNWEPSMRDWVLAAADLSLPDPVVEELDKSLALAPDAALGHLYAQVVSGARRRVLGTFFTPAVEVGPMLEMWAEVESSPSRVIDVGAGVGVFTAAAAQRWPKARVAAVDVNPVTLGLLGARMAQPDVSDAKARVDLVLQDFTSWFPTQARKRGERRLILGNPPYTRSQLIAPEMRSRLAEETAHLCGSRASLSAYITALALLHLKPRDGMCLLLPAQWLESEYARGLRGHLLGLKSRRVELRLVNSTWFEDATVDAVVLIVGTERTEAQPFVVAEWGRSTGRTLDRESASASEWRSWFDADPKQPIPSAPGQRRLLEVARVRRGTATGANKFFLLSDDLVREHNLPESALVPVVRRLAGYENSVTHHQFDQHAANERRWMLRISAVDLKLEQVAAYVAFGKSEGFNQGHLCRVRAGDWFDLEHDLFVPDVIVTSMTRDGIRVVENGIEATITNNLYGWVWQPGMTLKTRSAILAWLRSEDGQTALLTQCRRQGDGLAKVEPKALASLLLPAYLFT